MGLLGGLFRTAINVATLPVDVARDVVETAVGVDSKETNTEKKIKKSKRDLENMFDF